MKELIERTENNKVKIGTNVAIAHLVTPIIEGARSGRSLTDEDGEFMPASCFTISPNGELFKQRLYDTSGDGVLSILQEEVGGYIELFYRGPNFHFYCNEEGKLNDMEDNNLADCVTMALMVSQGALGCFNLVGPVCLVVDEKTADEITRALHEQQD
jgi:hypothetical protein